jgi:protein involved in sex pheromone biosynthesis
MAADADDEDGDETWPQPPTDKKAKKKQRKDQRRQQVENAVSSRATSEDLTRRMINLTKGKTSTLSSRVSTAFEAGRWEDALVCLVAMRYAEQAPKLGSVQR